MDETLVSVLAGGIGGTMGSVATCPLEVVKVRLQSSAVTLAGGVSPLHANHPNSSTAVLRSKSMGIVKCIRSIVKAEGSRALFKGIGPTLIGVLPSRCIYFASYHNGQMFFSDYFESRTAIFMCSSAIGGFITATVTNPLFYVKTMLQLDQGAGNTTLKIWQLIRNTWNTSGVRGFYRGVTASYFGISETVINFVIYENVKADLLEWRHTILVGKSTDVASRLQSPWDTFMCALPASILSKTIATMSAYPHEVVRTRLREDPVKYRKFVQCLLLIGREEGARGLYGGLLTHYVRQVPNTCILMGTYELVVYLFRHWGLTASDVDN